MASVGARGTSLRLSLLLRSENGRHMCNGSFSRIDGSNNILRALHSTSSMPYLTAASILPLCLPDFQGGVGSSTRLISVTGITLRPRYISSCALRPCDRGSRTLGDGNDLQATLHAEIHVVGRMEDNVRLVGMELWRLHVRAWGCFASDLYASSIP